MRVLIAIGAALSLALLPGSVRSARCQTLVPGAAQAAFNEARQLSAADGGRTWGVGLYGPMIFVDPVTNTAIANQPDREGILKKVAGVYEGKLPENILASNTAIEWEGKRWTMVQWPRPQNELARNLLLAHEMFHRVEPSLGIPVRDAVNEHLDSLPGRLWTFLEWRALSAALSAPSGQLQATAVADALLFRRHREELFPGSSAQEQALELNEGLAEYTGVVFSEPDAASARWHAIARLADPTTSQSLVRSFAYTSGPGYGLLLDERSPGWRKKIGATADLPSLLSLTVPAIHGSISARAALYGAAALQADETERKGKTDASKAQYRALLVSGPTLTLPIVGALDFTFDPGEVIPLEDNGTVYPTLHASDDWGSLDVTQGALVSFPKQIVRVAAPAGGTANGSEGTIDGPGWRLKLAPGWVLEATAKGSFIARKK